MVATNGIVGLNIGNGYSIKTNLVQPIHAQADMITLFLDGVLTSKGYEGKHYQEVHQSDLKRDATKDTKSLIAHAGGVKMIFTESFIRNTENHVNKFGFQYPQEISEYGDDMFILSIDSVKPAIADMETRDIPEGRRSFILDIEDDDRLSVFTNAVITLPWIYTLIEVQISADFNISMIDSDGKSPLSSSVAYLLNRLELAYIYLTLFGIRFRVSWLSPYITMYCAQYINDFLTSLT